jgi:hypothetical protein
MKFKGTAPAAVRKKKRYCHPQILGIGVRSYGERGFSSPWINLFLAPIFMKELIFTRLFGTTY